MIKSFHTVVLKFRLNEARGWWCWYGFFVDKKEKKNDYKNATCVSVMYNFSYFRQVFFSATLPSKSFRKQKISAAYHRFMLFFSFVNAG